MRLAPMRCCLANITAANRPFGLIRRTANRNRMLSGKLAHRKNGEVDMRNGFGKSLLALGMVALAAPALADRGPSQEEAQIIAAKLTADGYKSWGKIEYDDHIWEIDNARTVEGKTYDLKLNPRFEIVKKDRD
jgi:hypothetical protein